MRYILPLLPVALASADDWQLRDLASQCALGGSSSISFNYYPADAEISTSNFKAQDCTYAQITVTNDQTVDIDGKTFRSYTMSYDPSVCSGATFVAGDLASYSSTTQFEFDTGMTAAGQFLNFRSHIIPASCTYDSSYSLEYNFGQIQKKTDYGESDDDDPTTPDTQSTEGGISFNMAAYTEAARQNLITADALTAGDSSYVTISPATSGVAGFTYAPTSCKLDEDECDAAGENCVNKNSFTLFDGAATTCTNAGPLGFTIAYDGASKSWNFEFMLFLFNPAAINQYKLKCEVKVCAENQDPASACNAMAASCLDASQTYYTPCAQGEAWNSGSNSCEATTVDISSPSYVSHYDMPGIWYKSASIGFDDDHFYHPGRTADDEPIVKAYGKTDGLLKKTYNHGLTGRGWYHDIAVTDKFLIVTLSNNANNNAWDDCRVEVFNKETRALVYTQYQAKPLMVESDGTNVFVSDQSNTQIFYTIDDDGKLTQRDTTNTDWGSLGNCGALFVDADYAYMACTHNGQTATVVFDKTTLEIKYSLTGHTQVINAIRSYEGYIITGGNDGRMILYNKDTGAEFRNYSYGGWFTAMDVNGGKIFSNRYNSLITEVRDWKKAVDDGDFTVEKTINEGVAVPNACWAMHYESDVKQLFLGCGTGRLITYQLG